MSNLDNMMIGRRERELAAFDKFTKVVQTGTSGVCINNRIEWYMKDAFTPDAAKRAFLRAIGAY